jgi:hypothetical protein
MVVMAQVLPVVGKGDTSRRQFQPVYAYIIGELVEILTRNLVRWYGY